MQLKRLVAFHKVIADPTRLRILVLLAKEPLHGQALAGKLGLTPPTITHHISKLREIGLIYERRVKNTIYIHLDPIAFRRDVEAVLQLVFPDEQKEVYMTEEKEQLSVLRNFFTSDGKLKQLPGKQKKRLIVLEHLIRTLQVGKKYTEKEINEHLQSFHEDYATIRRELVIHHFFYRENGIYELNPPEMWRSRSGI
ncbi:DUF2087 domain-containing protein [Risungbinella massiliensis]|uniref:DUF2087 domain-containing protein n=1 Tax=Risungbinella massiliensis TaxID=1329796 RepID=UPI0005CC0DDD|nr:metalloregulator ArsR/SmtB family transcription factor [Risungbinella massiliensis]